ncbi:hypothetical protein G9A89_013177 [Geosiphon pyriformis]|nr:hypothetical protein G9A89_013177 [Geosiphon pyriformis]
MPTTYFSPTVKVPLLIAAHTAEGTFLKIEDVKVYTVGASKNKKAVIVMHDLMGFTSTAQQICDRIAQQGYLVVMPYLFRADLAYNFEKAVKESLKENSEWVNAIAPNEHIIAVLNQVINFLQQNGEEHIGILGLSWGGKCAALASQNKAISAVVSIHTPWFDYKDMQDTQCPIAVITSGDLPDLTSAVQNLKKLKPFGRKIIHARFPEMRYGCVGPFGDYTNQTVAELATDALKIAVTFFRENIGIRNY